jgi:hypothetical protein
MGQGVRINVGLLALLASAACVPATTLVRLSLDEMVEKSTDIVRGRVRDCNGAQRGAFVVTQCLVQVTERIKGKPSSLLTVTIPGGKVAGTRMRQVIAGAPELDPRQDYLLFLWTGSNGLTQLIGLSQGVLEVKQSGSALIAVRSRIQGATLEDSKGQEVSDGGLSVSLETVRRRAAKGAVR